jgi:hypothetical protein
MAKKQQKHIDENDFEALDRLAHSITPEMMRPMSPADRRRWEAAKRGRPRKPAGTKSVPTMITVEPKLLRLIEAQAKKTGMSRSQFFADAARLRLGLAG